MDEQTILYRQIGIIHTPHKQREGMPIQTVKAVGADGQVEVEKQYRPALIDLDGFSHIILLYHFHQSCKAALTVRPFLDDTKHGLFATRHPDRPNPIGLSVVRLMRVELDPQPILYVRNVDMLDGSPLLDIKPYVPAFDVHPANRTGWIGAQGDDLEHRPWRANFDIGED